MGKKKQNICLFSPYCVIRHVMVNIEAVCILCGLDIVNGRGGSFFYCNFALEVCGYKRKGFTD